MWDFINNIFAGLSSAVIGMIRSSRLTGAEREQNRFNAQQAEMDRQFQARQAEMANQFTAGQTQAQMNFQESMANTQYQRTVQDMQAAGVNPALAMSNGANAAPSGAAGSGVAASGAAASGSGRGVPFTMSEIMAAMKMRKEMDLLDAQREETLANAENLRNNAAKTALETDWLPRRFASEIGLNTANTERASQEIKNLVASEEGQRLANEWNPKLWQNDLANGEVNREATIIGIQRVLQEIENLRVENTGLLEDVRIKQLTQGLVAMQTVLAGENARQVSASAWRSEFENEYTKMYGHKPDEPIWNAATSLISTGTGNLRKAIVSGGKAVGKGVSKVAHSRLFRSNVRQFSDYHSFVGSLNNW